MEAFLFKYFYLNKNRRFFVQTPTKLKFPQIVRMVDGSASQSILKSIMIG